MTGKTHALAGFAVGCGLLLSAPLSVQAVLFLPCTIAGSLFPDIDQRTSKAGSAAPLASWMIQHIFGHRTLFHSPILYLVAYCAASVFWPHLAPYILAFTLGAASHLLLDMFNSKGIPLFYPWPRRFHIAAFPLNGLGEIVTRGFLLLASIYLVGQNILAFWPRW